MISDWLVALGLPGWLRDELKGRQVCECGAPAAALGMWQHARATNAMWLCAEHAGQVDAGVTVLPIPGAAEMDREALFAALVRAEIKRLAVCCAPVTPSTWDKHRSSYLPKAVVVERRLRQQWNQVIADVLTGPQIGG